MGEISFCSARRVLVKLKGKNRIWLLRGYMHHLADSMTELCHGGEHYDADRKGIPVDYRSGEKAKFIVIGRAGDLSLCQRVGEFGLPSAPYKVFRSWNCHKVICDLIHQN